MVLFVLEGGAIDMPEKKISSERGKSPRDTSNERKKVFMKKKNILYMIAVLVIISVCYFSSNAYLVNAKQYELNVDYSGFGSSNDDIGASIYEKGRRGSNPPIVCDTTNKLLVLNYWGPYMAKECRCENALQLEVQKRWYYWHQYEEVYYVSDYFDWNDNRCFYVYLPTFTKKEGNVNLETGYQVVLKRLHSDLHNKGAYDESNNYSPDKSHFDDVNVFAYYYEVNKIGVDDNWFGVGDKRKAEFVCDDFYGNITWTTDNENILHIDSEGVVQALKSGEAKIYLNIDDQRVFEQTIYVEDLVMQTDMTLFENDSQKILVSGARNDIVWKSENDLVATVSAGEVIAKNIGSTRIVGYLNDLEVFFNVTIKPRTLSVSKFDLYSGETKELTVSGTKIKVEWSSTDSSVVTVNNGVISALKPGNATIVAKVGSQNLECKVYVQKSSLRRDDYELAVGSKATIDIIGSKITPEYTSSDENVIVVKKGELSAVGAGKATISIKIGNEVLKCKVKVKKLIAPTGFVYKASSKIIKLEWNDYSGAKSYSIYMLNEEKKEYELVATVKNASYVAKDLEPGKKYTFKIAANVKIFGNLLEQALSDKIKCKTDKKERVGWQTIDGKKYYYKNGFAVVGSGLRKIDGKKYIFNSDGSLVVDKFSTIDGAMYYSKDSGEVAVSTEVTNKKEGVTYVADKNGILTKKKVKTATKTITFNDITIDIPTSWGKQTKDGDSINYSFGSTMIMIYTDPKNGSLNQKKADSLVDEFEEYICTYLDITKSKKDEHADKKISTYYSYNISFGIPTDWSNTTSVACKGRLTAFEYNGKYYVAVIMVEKSIYKDDSFDEYNDAIKSIKTITKSSGGGTNKNNNSGTNKNSGQKTTTYVWVTETGKHYHRINNCGNGTYWQEDIESAKSRGLTPCGKCFK